MSDRKADVVIIGAGIAGVSTAYQLAVTHGVGKVVLVDPRPPLTLTSDKSTECYRNWWPNKPMVGLMNRSIDMFERLADITDNIFGLSRRGYLFVTAEESQLDEMLDQAALTSRFGGGDVRVHSNSDEYVDHPDGVDVLGPAELRQHFPYITNSAIGAVHVRRAGWFSAQQLGSWMLDRTKDHGAELVVGEVTAVSVEAGQIQGVTLDDGSTIATKTVVNAAGPMSESVGTMAGVDLPLFSELHLKVGFRDHRSVIPRDAPMIIWSDTQEIDWSEDERAELDRMGRQDLLGTMPIFCHGRPEGTGDSPYFLALWEYHQDVLEPEWPLPEDPLYPEAVMRGLTTMVPGLKVYLEGLPESTVDGGYYTKTPENRPLIGPCGPRGFHVVTGMSGFGVMISTGAADLAARHIVGADLPEYASDFLLSRYDDAQYLELIEGQQRSGQL